MRPDPRELAESWLATAEQDLAVATEIAERYPSTACFHAQQAGEKALKALLVAVAGDVVHTHRTDALLAEARSLGIGLEGDVVGALEALEKYYLPTRYPDALGMGSPTSAYKRADADLAISHATLVLGAVRARLRHED